MIGFIQAMACFPEAQKKGQEEIDRVIGSKRLPTMDDEYDLPYIRAMVKETLRWMPTTVTGAVPHAATKDDYYNGYFIPKGAQLMNNVYAIHMDENRYPNPREYRPERYEGDTQTAADSAANPEAVKRDHFGFGAGRRICQGMHIAERSLFLGMSRMLWGFNITQKIRDGKLVPINTDKLTQGFVCMPDTFECEIRPRDAYRARIIREEWQECMTEYIDSETLQIKSGVNLTHEIIK
jgi:cytochrome P450